MAGEDRELPFPPGYRFEPTDEELVCHYFRAKLLGQPRPYGIVTDANVYDCHPAELLGSKDEAYFFSMRRRKYLNGARPDRQAGDGFWKLSSGVQPVVPGIGKSPLVYYEGLRPNGKKTDWLMHEYTALPPEQLDRCVLCKIYKKKGTEEGKNSGGNHEPNVSEDQPAGRSSWPSLSSTSDQGIKGLMREDSLLRSILTGNQVRPVAAMSHLPAAPPVLDQMGQSDGDPFSARFRNAMSLAQPEPSVLQYCPLLPAISQLAPLHIFDPAASFDGANGPEATDHNSIAVYGQSVSPAPLHIFDPAASFDGANGPEATDHGNSVAVYGQSVSPAPLHIFDPAASFDGANGPEATDHGNSVAVYGQSSGGLRSPGIEPMSVNDDILDRICLDDSWIASSIDVFGESSGGFAPHGIEPATVNEYCIGNTYCLDDSVVNRPEAIVNAIAASGQSSGGVNNGIGDHTYGLDDSWIDNSIANRPEAIENTTPLPDYSIAIENTTPLPDNSIANRPEAIENTTSLPDNSIANRPEAIENTTSLPSADLLQWWLYLMPKPSQQP